MCPDMYLIGHHFDDMRPHRLISFLRSKPWAVSTPIVVEIALPLTRPAIDEEQLRRSYIRLGANGYVSLFDHMRRAGRGAGVSELKSIVRAQLGDGSRRT